MRASAFGLTAALVVSGLGAVLSAAPAAHANDAIVEKVTQSGGRGTDTPLTGLYAVPPGVSAATVVVDGASGGDTTLGSETAQGGQGTRVTSRFAVTSGQSIRLVVGNSGTNGGSRHAPGKGGKGHASGGDGNTGSKDGRAGAGGGGATSAMLHPDVAGTASGITLALAAGGGGAGGAGGSTNTSQVTRALGGDGGDNGGDGGRGRQTSLFSAQLMKWIPITTSGAPGGKGSANSGLAGAKGAGAKSDSNQGGGGGGGAGSSGGLGGERGNATPSTSNASGGHAAGGGGAGSSLTMSSMSQFPISGITKTVAPKGSGSASIQWIWDTSVRATAPTTAIYTGSSFALPVDLRTLGRDTSTAGTVRVYDGTASNATELVTASVTNAATLTIPGLTRGAHQLRVVFTPSNTTARNPSEVVVPTTVVDVPATTTSLSISSASGVVNEGSHTLSASARVTSTGAPANAAVSILRQRGSAPATDDAVIASGIGSANITVPNSSAGTFRYYAKTAVGASSAASQSSTVTANIAAKVTELLVTAPTTDPIVGDAAEVIVRLPKGSTPSGTVTAKRGSTTVATKQIDSSGSATFSIVGQAVGADLITFSLTDNVNVADPRSITLEWQRIPSAVTINDPAAISASGSSTITAQATRKGSKATSGSVVFIINGVRQAAKPIANGAAQYVFTRPAAGIHTIAAEYSDGTNVAVSRTTQTTLTVSPAQSTTAVTAAPSSTAYGSDVTFTAAIAAGGRSTTGSVEFINNDGVILGSTAVTNGSATLRTAALAAGDHQVIARYSGDASTQASSSSAAAVTVTRAAVTATLAALPASIPAGAMTPFEARVCTVNASAPRPAGVLELSLGEDVVATTSTGTGSANCTIFTGEFFAPKAGTMDVTASFVGGSNHGDARTAGSTSGTEAPQVTVEKADSTTLVTVPETTPVGVAITADISARAGQLALSGAVDVFVDGDSIGEHTLVDGNVQVALDALEPGEHTIRASYLGSADARTSQSTTTTFTVSKQTASLSVETSKDEVTFGTPVTFTAVLTSAVSPTGTIVLRDGNTVLAEVPLKTNGSAVFSTTSLAVGSRSITASYAGDSNVVAASTTEPVTVTVAKAPVTVTLTRTAPAPFPGATVAFNANVCATTATAGVPTGTAKFRIGTKTYWGKTVSTGNACRTFRVQYSAPAIGAVEHQVAFTGTGSFESNASGAENLTIRPWSTRMVVARTATTTQVGGSAALTVRMTSFGEVATSARSNLPQGTVRLVVDGKATNVVAKLVDGRATLKVPTSTVGKKSLTVRYTPSTSKFLPVTSKATLVNVTKARTVTTTSFSRSVVAPKTKVTLTTKVCASTGGTPRGSLRVTFNGTKRVVTSSKVSGSCRVFTTAFAPSASGRYATTAEYRGSDMHRASSSRVVNLLVR